VVPLLKDPVNGAVGTDAEILQGATAGAILLNGGVTVGGRQLSDHRSRSTENIPVESLVAGPSANEVIGIPVMSTGGLCSARGADGIRSQDTVAIEGQSAGLQYSRLRNTIDGIKVGGRDGNRIAPGVDDRGSAGWALTAATPFAPAPVFQLRFGGASTGAVAASRGAGTSAVKSITPLPASVAVTAGLVAVPVRSRPEVAVRGIGILPLMHSPDWR